MEGLNIPKRMAELLEPIDQQIMMCDDRRDLLMLNVAMLQRSINILDLLIGVEGRKLMLRDKV
jgi:hypothetical protein